MGKWTPRGLRRFAPALLCLTLAACASPDHSSRLTENRFLRDGRHFCLAIYNRDGKLINTPMEHMRRDFAVADRPYSHVLVIAHGWNFTVGEAIANYAAYIEAIDSEIRPATPPREAFRPYLVFVTWDSASRPLEDAAAALLPLGLDRLIFPATLSADQVIHVLTAWGESISRGRAGAALHRAQLRRQADGPGDDRGVGRPQAARPDDRGHDPQPAAIQRRLSSEGALLPAQ
jgi:hypothetical protein